MKFQKDVDMYTFQSEFSRDLFVKQGFDRKKTQIIENPYNSEKPYIEYATENENRFILYFGRISKEKGLFTLYEAMKNIPNIHLKIIGNGPDLNTSLEYIKNNKILNIEFLGAKWGDELLPYIKKSEFVVVPSEWYEPNPYVVLQAFSFSKPVVATNIGGLKDMIQNNINGLLTKHNDSLDLSLTINNLYHDKEKIKILGKNAKELLESKHNPINYYNKSIELFNNLLNKTNS